MDRRPTPASLGAACLAFLLLTGCHFHASPTPTPTPSAPGNSATPSRSTTLSIDPAHDLFTPGLAAQVVAELAGKARGPIVRVVIDRTQVRLTYVASGDRPATLKWTKGETTESDDGTDLVTATPFDPAAFNLTDIAALFAQASEIAGDDTRQELQINEYNLGQVLMTVTTNPETTTVFFNADGTLIPRLDLTDNEALATAIADATAGQAPDAVVIDRDQQVAADYRRPNGIVERRIRPMTGPVYITRRKETLSTIAFDPAQIDVAVVGRILRTYPGMLSNSSASPITITISREAEDPQPRLRVAVGNQVEVLDLTGVPVDEG